MSQQPDRTDTVGNLQPELHKRRDLLRFTGMSSLALLAVPALNVTAAEAAASYSSPTKSLCGWDHTSSAGPSIRDTTEFLPGEMERHETFTLEAIRMSQQAEAHCNHPFGAILVLPPPANEPEREYTVILRGENRVHTDGDDNQHAESRLVSDANKSAHITKEMLARSILYTSAEPCAMCCGSIFWAGIRTVVYAAPHDSFGTPSFPVPCREVFKFADINSAVTVIGPVLAEVSTPIVAGYFANRWRDVADDCRISNKL